MVARAAAAAADVTAGAGAGADADDAEDDDEAAEGPVADVDVFDDTRGSVTLYGGT